MHHLSRPRTVNAASMLVAAAGILLIFGAAPDLFPTIPPGPIILVAAAGLVAFVVRRWTAVVGVAVPAFIVLGGVASGGLVDNLGENPTAIAGTVIQLVALGAAIVFGLRVLTTSPAPLDGAS